MANHEQLDILKLGVHKWEAWRLENPFEQLDLSGANLFEADLRGANLRKVDIARAKLIGANLVMADLSRADLRAADLRGADLSLADLSGADLSGADLMTAKLTGAKFGGTNLAGVKMGACVLASVDLSEAIGLNTVEHVGPSSLGIDTIFSSLGKIPIGSLRGAGVPESLITYLPSLLGTGIEFYSLFISYSTADEEFARRLHADLQDRGVRCWFAPYDMRTGMKVHEQIGEAIQFHDRLLLILSPSSMESAWVETEISTARKRELAENRKVLYPISVCSFKELRDWKSFDADTGKDSAREIREYFIPDFSSWKDHDSYLKVFGKLIEDLNKRGRLA